MKNVIKILTIVIILFFIFTNYSMAGDALDIGEFVNKPTSAMDNAGSALNSVLSVIQVIGVAVAVIMLMVLAIKYMIASSSDRADIKKHAIIYVTGAILLFGAS